MTLPFRAPEIPAGFRHALPRGIRIVTRGDHEFIVISELLCPTGCSLITPTVSLHGEDAICLKVRAGGTQGLLFLAAHWGGHKKLFDFMFRQGDADPVIEAFCPHCNIPMTVESRCRWPGCHSLKKIEFHLPDPGCRILACARWGCPEHELISAAVPRELLDSVSRINFFGEGEESIFSAR